MDFFSLLSLANVSEPELELAQKKQAALPPEVLQQLSSAPSCTNGYHLQVTSKRSNGLVINGGFVKMNGKRRRDQQLSAGGWQGLDEMEDDLGCPTKVSK